MWRRQEGNHSDLFEVGEAQVNYFLINGFEPQLCITVYLISKTERESSLCSFSIVSWLR